MGVLTNIKGQCLCGGVKVEVKEAKDELGVCHCGSCRSWGAGPFLGLDCGTTAEFNGEGNINVYDSSDWAERGFCNKCGSNLFYRFKANKQTIVSSEIFKGLDLKMDHQIYIDSKPAYYHFKEDTKVMTEAEVIEAFAPKN